jgi:hypothetical protein
MGWTHWRILATRSYDWSVYISRDGPACYELAVGTRPSNRRVMYVGETGDLRARLAGYARHGNHLWAALSDYLRGPAKLYYRIYPTASKREAQAVEATRLRDSPERYPWNRKKRIVSVLHVVEHDAGE